MTAVVEEVNYVADQGMAHAEGRSRDIIGNAGVDPRRIALVRPGRIRPKKVASRPAATHVRN